MPDSSRPTLCFATMCKNEEHCIRNTLESVHKYIDNWVVCDTGSTDRTCEIVTEFFKEKNIPGELFVDKWVGFDHNKTLMMQRAHNRSDYVMHLDADDLLVGDFHFDNRDAGQDCYFIPVRRADAEWKALIIFDNRLRWRFAGVAHTIIRCLERPAYSTGDLSHYGYYISGEGIGSRSFDPKKYLYDAEKLTKQFFDTLVSDPDGLNSRSVFYAAQSYMDSRMYREALQWNRLYLKLKDTWIEEVFEAQMRVAKCLMALEASPDEIMAEMNNAINIFPDRSEPSYALGKYMNQIGRFELGYRYLRKAQENDLEQVKAKYRLFVNDKCYGKYVNDELSVSCYWTGRLDEGLKLLQEIIDDKAFASEKARLQDNFRHFTNKMTASQQT